MGKIATEADVKAVGGQGTAVTNKCCRKERVADLGCELTKARNTNQLVEEGTFEKTVKDILFYMENKDVNIKESITGTNIKIIRSENGYCLIGITANNFTPNVLADSTVDYPSFGIVFDISNKSYFSSVSVTNEVNCNAEWNNYTGTSELIVTNVKDSNCKCTVNCKYGNFYGKIEYQLRIIL